MVSPEDPTVALVEEILAAAAAAAGEVPTEDGRAVADRAVWLCACVADNGPEAPTWVIYDVANGGLGWRLVPDRLDVSDLVAAPVMDGDHVSPEEVLDWLRGADSGPWSRHAGAAGTVMGDLARRIRDLRNG